MLHLYALNQILLTLEDLGEPKIESKKDLKRLLSTQDYEGCDDTDAEDVTLLKMHPEEAITMRGILRRLEKNRDVIDDLWKYIGTHLPGRRVGSAYSRRCPEGLLHALVELVEQDLE